MSFAADLLRFKNKTLVVVKETRRAIGIKLFSAVIMDTPVGDVDGGRLRASWQTTLSAPAQSGIARKDVFAALQDVDSTLTGEDGAAYLTNLMPYAHRIEYDGWSHTKAPSGMVRRNVARFQKIVTETVRKGKL